MYPMLHLFANWFVPCDFIWTCVELGWLVGLRPIVHMWDLSLRGDAFRGGLSKVSSPVFKRTSEKTTETSEWLSRQVRSGIEAHTTRLTVYIAELLSHWWGEPE